MFHYLMMSIEVFILLAVYYVNIQAQTFNATTIPKGSDGTNPVIAAVENSPNIELYCKVTRLSDGVVRATQWTLLRPGMSPIFIFFLTNGSGNVGFENFFVEDINTFATNLTILKFYSTFDNTQIGCGSGGEIAERFDLKLIKPPILHQVSIPQSVAENTTFSFNIENTTGYPLLPHFTWFYNEVVISPDSTNPNISVYPYITFSSVSRYQSGNYSMIASNEGGNSTGYFILDVQYGPEAIIQSGLVYVITNNDVIITSYTNISGNPIPSSSWSKDGGLSISSGGRFNSDILGQLMITSVLLSDGGHYNNTLENTIVNTTLSISNIIDIVVVDPPSQPREVSIIGDPGSTTVNLTWHNPSVLGTSPLSLFRVMLDPLTNGLSTIMINYTATNSTDPTFINSVMITGLYPNTQYSVRVRAYSTHNVVGILASNSSTVVIFNTTSTVPELQSVLLTNVYGNLTVKWTFLHTGGIPLNNISISFEQLEESDNSSELTNTLLCTSMNECIVESISVGPVTAGTKYSCIVTVTNSIGNDMMRSNTINVITGIPSKPIISSVSGDHPGQAILSIYTIYSGITDVSTFHYIIIVLGINQTMMTVRPQLSEFNGVTINTTIKVVLSPGRYQFIVISCNIYGKSEQSRNSSVIMIVPRPTPTTKSISTTPTLTSPQSTDSRPSILSDVVIAGIIISIIIFLVLIVVILIVIIILIYKVSSTKESRGESSPVIKEFFSVKNEAYGLTKGPTDQSSIEVTENVSYSRMEQQSSLITPPVYETINQDNTDVYDNINDYI